MNEKWQELRDKTAELSLRERGILAATSAVVILVIWLQFVFTPFEKESKAVNQKIASANQTIAEQSAKIASLAASLDNNPNDALREEQAGLREQLDALRTDIETRLDSLVPPEKMADLMREVLSDYKGLKLVSAQNLPVEPIHIQSSKAPGAGESGKDSQNNAQAVIFSHGFEIELVGGYFQAIEFLQKLEEMSGFYWQMLDYEVKTYPNALIKIQLSTLSLEEDWIGV